MEIELEMCNDIHIIRDKNDITIEDRINTIRIPIIEIKSIKINSNVIEIATINGEIKIFLKSEKGEIEKLLL